jgi:hypothetical protein
MLWRKSKQALQQTPNLAAHSKLTLNLEEVIHHDTKSSELAFSYWLCGLCDSLQSHLCG